MKKYLLILLMLAATASASFLGIKQASETIKFSLNEPLDSLSGIPRVPDSFHVITMADNGTNLAYSNRSTTYPFAVGVDTVKHFGDTLYYFEDQIQDIDGAGGHFLLDITCTFWFDDIPTYTFATVQIVSDSLENFLDASKDSSSSGAVLSKNNLDSLQAQDGWVAKEASLTPIIDTVNAIIDTLQNQDNWVAKEASLFDPTSDSVIVDVSSADAGLIPNMVDSTLDEVNTGGTHNIVNSFGRQVRELSTSTIRVGLSQGMAGTSSNIVLLDASASAVSGSYDPSQITNVETGETHYIIEYDETNKAAYLFRDMKTPFSNGDEFKISAWGGFVVVNDGRIRGVTSNTITLNPLASSDDDTYNNQTIFVSSGDGSDWAYKVKNYIGSTKTVELFDDMTVLPDDSSMYIIVPLGDGFENRFKDSLFTNPIPAVMVDTTTTGDSTLTKQMLLAMPVSDTVTNTYFSQLIRQMNLNVFQVDSLQMYMGYNSTSSRSTNGTSSETDTLHIFEGATEIRRLLFWHIGGAAGDAPDSVTVAL